MTKNKVFIATSLDGFIADKAGQIDWLHELPNPQGDDMGYAEFMESVDALVMGRKTFETVLGFDMDWPYDKPVFVLSTSLTEIPQELEGKVFLKKGDLTEITAEIHQLGYNHLYIDGGRTIQQFLEADMIHEMTLTTIPILLGGGIPLFGNREKRLHFKCIGTRHCIAAVAQARYVRIKP